MGCNLLLLLVLMLKLSQILPVTVSLIWFLCPSNMFPSFFEHCPFWKQGSSWLFLALVESAIYLQGAFSIENVLFNYQGFICCFLLKIFYLIIRQMLVKLCDTAVFWLCNLNTLFLHSFWLWIIMWWVVQVILHEDYRSFCWVHHFPLDLI